MIPARPWLAAACGVLLAIPARAVEPPAPYGAQWPSYNNTYDGERFSPLKSIDPAAAGAMHEVCRARIAETGSFQSGPLVVEGTLYVTTAHDTIALDPTRCTIKWRSRWVPEQDELGLGNRGAAYANGRLYRGTPDGRLLALDAATGRILWKDVVAEASRSDFLSAAPIAWNGLVIVGTAGSDWGGHGRVMGYDAETGRELWRFDTIPTGTAAGADSWRTPGTQSHGGGGTWTAYTLDPTAEELFIPVGNPAPDFAPQYREGENLFTDSLVVLDPRTGALKWWYQMSPHDGQDHDLSAAPVLLRSPAGADLVLLAGKEGFVTALDRATHQPVWRTPITTIENEGKAPTVAGVHICPGMLGGTEWNGPAYDPGRQTIFAGAVDWCATYRTEAANAPYDPAGMFMGGTFENDPGSGTGWLTALDPASGAIRWRFHAPAPVVGGVTPTAGGVVLAGDMAGTFYAFDAMTGQVLRQLATGGAIAGGVVAYEIGGRPYAALTSGNVSRVTFGALGQPTVIVMGFGAGAAVAGAPDPARGGRLFAQSCAACHGPAGTAMANHDLHRVAAKASPAEIAERIRAPRPPMPRLFPQPFNERDVSDIAAFVHTL